MNVATLINRLKKMDPNAEVVFAAFELGFGTDFTISGLHQFDDTNYVRLLPGEAFED